MRFLSGIRPTNLLHIGNYFGAIRQFIEFQRTHDGFVMIADLHALDTETRPDALHRNILTLTAAYLAAGLDAKKNVLFLQSAIPEHAELAHIFSALVSMGELARMTQYKEKAGLSFTSNFNKKTIDLIKEQDQNDTLPNSNRIYKHISEKQENVKVALFSYPLLMAADILMYDPDIVPVGDDQKQHVELARTIASRFNNAFGTILKEPEPYIRSRSGGARIMGLDDPTKKMSKSAASAKNYIALTDDDDTIRDKIMSAITDSKSTIAYADDQPGVRNLIDLLHVKTGLPVKNIVASYTGKKYVELKRDVADAMVAFVEPLRTGIETHLRDEAALTQIIRDGSARARELAAIKLTAVRKAIGIFA